MDSKGVIVGKKIGLHGTVDGIDAKEDGTLQCDPVVLTYTIVLQCNSLNDWLDIGRPDFGVGGGSDIDGRCANVETFRRTDS
jgi:hypothetical protein